MDARFELKGLLAPNARELARLSWPLPQPDGSLAWLELLLEANPASVTSPT